MSCPCHALTMPFFSRPQHNMSVERRPVAYLPAFSFFRLPHGVPRRLLSEAYQSQMQVASVKPNSVCHGRGKEWWQHTTKKDNLLNCWTSSFGYFWLPCGLSRRTRHYRNRAGDQHGMCELMAWHGRGTAWARHAMCESALTVSQ
jgi:hypothetical protein